LQGEGSSLPNRFPGILEIHPNGLEKFSEDGVPNERVARAKQVRRHAEDAMESRDFDLVVLENIGDPIREGILDEKEISAAVSKRPEGLRGSVLTAGGTCAGPITRREELKGKRRIYLPR
jgi:ATP:corrinoid adenosyltransferase